MKALINFSNALGVNFGPRKNKYCRGLSILYLHAPKCETLHGI